MSQDISRQYESVIIFNSRLNDAQIKDEIKRFEGILTQNSGKNIAVDNWGRKEIAYSVKKSKQGVFVVFKYESENHEIPNQLSSLLRISDSVQKYQTHLLKTKTRKVKVNPKRVARSDEDFDDATDSFD